MEEIKKEKYIKGSTNPIFLEGAETIISQMKKCVCKINKGDAQQNTGFFCKIPYPDQAHLLSALVTCDFIIGRDYLKEGNTIRLSLNDEKEFKEIRITNSRKIFTNEKYNITFLELEPDDKINNYLEIDPNAFKPKEVLNNIYQSSSIYILHYLMGKKIAFSSGLIKEMDKYNISHSCNTEMGSSGGPILSSDTFKLIGIHIGTSKNSNFNKGIFIKFPIVDFIESNIGH